MSRKLVVYPLLFVNLAIGFWMYVLSHKLIMVTADIIFLRNGLGRGILGPVTYIQQSINGIGAIFLSIAALILFAVLESYYERFLKDWKLLLSKFFYIIGIQSVYLGMVQLLTQRVGSTAAPG